VIIANIHNYYISASDDISRHLDGAHIYWGLILYIRLVWEKKIKLIYTMFLSRLLRPNFLALKLNYHIIIFVLYNNISFIYKTNITLQS
jgi:hypothetical protein